MDCATAATGSATSFRLTPLALALVLTMGLAGPAQAAVFTVTNLNDAGAGSLRQAVVDANATAGADTVLFAPGVTGTITLTSGQLLVTDSITLSGPGAQALTVSGNNTSRVLYMHSSAALLDITISGLTVANGAANNGAGIMVIDENLTLDNVVLLNNQATGNGGGLHADGFNMALTVRNSVITGNTSGSRGGGIYVEDTGGLFLFQNTTISNNRAVRGGGVYLYDPDTPVLFDNCTISGNIASDRGGGIFLYDTDSTGTFTIQNSTISGNTAANGAGIFMLNPDNPVVLRNNTITGNTASGSGGGVFFQSANSTISIASTIVAGNTASSAANGDDIFNDAITLDVSNSLIQSASAGAINGTNMANITGTPALLGSLQNNGGPTQTHGLLAGSPAINTGSNPAGLATDQRGGGFARTVGSGTDIGAFEVQASPVVVPSAPHSIPTLSQWATGLLSAMVAMSAAWLGRRRKRK